MARVLIVEDEHPLRRIITLNLARRGYTVVETESVAAADEALAVTSFDVILLDVNLPDQTGWDLLRHIQEQGSASASDRQRPHVIVITALRPTDRRLAEFRPDAVLLKPFPIDALVRLVPRVLSQTPDGAEARV